MPNLVESLADIVTGFFKAIFAVLETFLSLVKGFVTELLTLAKSTVEFTFLAFIGFTYVQQRNPQVRRNVNNLKKKA
ncbi:hypothetical protein JCM10212_005124 [Sporobolomyces blumeae]